MFYVCWRRIYCIKKHTTSFPPLQRFYTNQGQTAHEALMATTESYKTVLIFKKKKKRNIYKQYGWDQPSTIRNRDPSIDISLNFDSHVHTWPVQVRIVMHATAS